MQYKINKTNYCTFEVYKDNKLDGRSYFIPYPNKKAADETISDYSSFEEALFSMEEEISRLDFDIALIGAGAYGSLLTLYVKKIGKMAIQTGGATMTLFGIMGKRWENRSHVSVHVNEDWIHPYSKPKGYGKVEGGCYW